MEKIYDVIIVGAGHAGCEAALAAARLGKKSAIFSMSLDNIAMMSCNPAMGGPGKSNLLSEIDILGGEIGRHTDNYNIQMKYLNDSKGVAARVIRAQADKFEYRTRMKEIIENTENLDVIQQVIEDIIVYDGEVKGVITNLGIKYYSKTVILTTGTFLKGRIVIGNVEYSAGRQGETSAEKLSENLKKYGLEIGRLQTATPPRIDKKSIDFSRVTPLFGEDNPKYFSIFTNKKENMNIPTWLTYTNEKTIEKVQEMLQYSPIVTGMIDTKGPRHCPSIDRKVLNFPEKKNHQVFLEQESSTSNEIYVNGMTTSMPPFAQEAVIKTIDGLENAKIVRYGYAVEYDYIPPYQLLPSYENKKIKNLYTAGQINGTSGYEEAAAQGFMAGVNAARRADNIEPVIIDRSEGYIGVLTDDLINKEFLEPYRVLPSRAEYRLTLRQDNPFMRLIDKSEKIGLLDKNKIEYLKEMKRKVERETERLKSEIIYPDLENNLVLEGMNEEKLKKSIRAADLLKRNNFSYRDLKYFINIKDYSEMVIEQIEINIKYEDFIIREQEQIEKYKVLENKKIPLDIDYDEMRGLSNIARDGLKKVKPFSVGQASRIPGVTGNDISILIGYLINTKN